jgi:hypothetical protein
MLMRESKKGLEINMSNFIICIYFLITSGRMRWLRLQHAKIIQNLYVLRPVVCRDVH